MIGTAVLSRDGVDLLGLIGRDTPLKNVAGTRGGEYAGPCPSCGGDDRFRVQPEQGLWWCRSCRTGWSDAIDYVRWRTGCSFVEACRELGVDLPDRPAPQQHAMIRANATAAMAPTPPTLADDSPEPSAAWRARGERYLAHAEAALWSDAGTRARRWLAARGLTEATMRRWRLGYQAADAYEDPLAWGLDGKRIWLPHGIVIPWFLDGNLWQVKFRRPDPLAPKYVAVRGGHPVLFGGETIDGHDVVVLAEGEFDVMLLEQLCGDLVAVATLGGASKQITATTAEYLLGARVLFTLYDTDTAGEKGAAQVAALTMRARRLRVPIGKDPTDFMQAGGDLRAWLTFELERLDLLMGDPSRKRAMATTVPLVEARHDGVPVRAWQGVQVHWGRERGDLAVRDPATGEWHEIRYRDATPVWKAAIRRTT
jgi:DNA primase